MLYVLFLSLQQPAFYVTLNNLYLLDLYKRLAILFTYSLSVRYRTFMAKVLFLLLDKLNFPTA
jgi:hypothetical protein